jgi:hypothetical protein
MPKKTEKTSFSSVIMVSRVLTASQGEYFSVQEIKEKISIMFETRIYSITIRRALESLKEITPMLKVINERSGKYKLPTNKYSIIINNK